MPLSKDFSTGILVGCAGAIGVAWAVKKLFASKPNLKSEIKLTYFNIEGVAEKCRLALKMSSTPFEDIGVPFPEWEALKPKTKYGTLPKIEIDGVARYQSDMLFMWVGLQDRKGGGPLFPESKEMEIMELLGLVTDMWQGFTPAMYIGIRPESIGHGDLSGDAKTKKIKEMRERYLANELPKFLKFFEDWILESGGPFLLGKEVTLADLSFYSRLRYFSLGIADYIPVNCLEINPTIVKYKKAMDSVPKIKAHYESKQKK
jgi:glutathione S-transferase